METGSYTPMPTPPKTWGEMTDAEKGALLLAAHEGKVIESKYAHESQWYSYEPRWDEDCAYRVRTDPARETVTMVGSKTKYVFWSFAPRNFMPTHRITFDTIDGEPVCDSIRMEAL